MKIRIRSLPITAPTTLCLALPMSCPTVSRGRGQSERIRRALLQLRPGEPLGWYLENHDYAFRAAKQVGIRVRTAKVDGKGIMAWRLE